MSTTIKGLYSFKYHKNLIIQTLKSRKGSAVGRWMCSCGSPSVRQHSPMVTLEVEITLKGGGSTTCISWFVRYILMWISENPANMYISTFIFSWITVIFVQVFKKVENINEVIVNM